MCVCVCVCVCVVALVEDKNVLKSINILFTFKLELRQKGGMSIALNIKTIGANKQIMLEPFPTTSIKLALARK